MELPKRKVIRLKDYDYSQNGAYFVTICAYNRDCIFGNVGADSISARLIKDTFFKIINQYNNVYCKDFVVMPNHIHAIIIISDNNKISLSNIIQEFKRYSTIEYIKMVKNSILPPFNKYIWQRSYYDHIIRNEKEYQKISEYISTNPQNWRNDVLFKN